MTGIELTLGIACLLLAVLILFSPVIIAARFMGPPAAIITICAYVMFLAGSGLAADRRRNRRP